VRWCPSHL